MWRRILESAGIAVTIVYFLRETEWNQFNCWQFTFGNEFEYVMPSGNPQSLHVLPARSSTAEFRVYGCKYSTGTGKLLLPNVVFFISDAKEAKLWLDCGPKGTSLCEENEKKRKFNPQMCYKLIFSFAKFHLIFLFDWIFNFNFSFLLIFNLVRNFGYLFPSHYNSQFISSTRTLLTRDETPFLFAFLAFCIQSEVNIILC